MTAPGEGPIGEGPIGEGSVGDTQAELRTWYSNEIWGHKLEDDDLLFEVMCLQVFQAGLTWRMVLDRRDAFRRGFHGWQIHRVAAMGTDSVERLLADPSMIRNRRKIEACVANAGIIQRIQADHGSFCRWFYHDLETDDLGELQKWLRGTFRFVGPEIARMWLMAAGRIETAAH